jgi:4-diphosphocytidyl-2C-methyl-D-erythritol kinase
MSFGPWAPGVAAEERRRQFRSLAALAAAFTGSGSPVVTAMRNAEADDAAAAHALDVLNSLPALTRRRILATFGAVTWPQRRRS